MGSVFGLAGALVGGGVFSRKKPTGPTDAEIERDRLMAQYKTQEFQYTNPYEDMTVNLQAAQMQQQGLAQNQANILEQLRGGTSGAGAAALTVSDSGKLETAGAGDFVVARILPNINSTASANNDQAEVLFVGPSIVKA